MSLKFDGGLTLPADSQGRTASVTSLKPVDMARFSKPAPGFEGMTLYHALVGILKCLFGLTVFIVLVYTIRHYVFTIQRLFGRQSQVYLDVTHAQWPRITVMVAAHNEEKVIADSLRALLDVDYPIERMTIVPINDRSVDRTRDIIDEIALQAPDRIKPFHRTGGKPGKAAALKDATEGIRDEIIIIFDADYLPGKRLIKQLVVPFFDPEVGATMGRVVPLNRGVNLLTQLLDLERAGGYQVDQQARANLDLTPQYGGTVGGIRMAALNAVGGWSDDVLAEDTDVTYRLRCAGWKIIYQNRSECYEEVPEEWPIRIRQLRRWAKGHHQVLLRQTGNVIRSPMLGPLQKFDALLLLSIFMISPLMLVGWLSALALFFMGMGSWLYGGMAVLIVAGFSSLGNFAAFFEIAGAVFLDGQRQRLNLLPLGLLTFLVSLVEISRATLEQTWNSLWGRGISWEKTLRYRTEVNVSEANRGG